ncbi:unnamed protein product, partial [Brugia timori]|uniref:DNA replication complex GINS protein PSF3 n=1 Tax=Brugia timori TaxID=42155 RepID=A0A0R3R1U6_9BILA
MERTQSALMDVDKNYYDIRDILACKQSLKCLFSSPLPRGELFLKVLDGNATEIFHLIGQRAPDMEGGFFRADLPLFMIRTLPNCRVCLLFNGGICENIKRKHSAYNDNEYIQVVPPTEFSPVQMQVLRAAPEHVDVMHLNQFYFILSKHIVRLIPEEKLGIWGYLISLFSDEDGRFLAETA